MDEVMTALASKISPLFAELSALLADRLSTSEAVCLQHGAGEGLRDVAAPDAVVFPKTTEEVAAVVRICAAYGTAITPYGAGTSLEGHLQSPAGGIVISLARMDRIVAINEADLDCRVEAGVTREALNSDLRATGLFFPIDPGANATIGGMAATRASGTNAVRYGTMREVVLGLTVVTSEGTIIRTGGRARKSSAGYDLTRLYIGSEGTLGIITEVQLRLFGVPELIAAATCQFDDITSATGAVMMAIQLGIPLARIELMDALQVEASIRYSGLSGLDPKPTLFFEFHGTQVSVAEQAQQVEEIARDYGGTAFAFSKTPEGRAALWKARHQAYYAARALHPGAEAFSTDACVPISRLADVVTEAQALAEASGLRCPIVGHVGDGNFHVFVIHDASERAVADRLASDIARVALRAGGTCTGEHGIGRHKLDLLVEEHGEAVGIMRRIKGCLDPDNRFNPGSTVPA
jgi:D-lactate dehydrogenase (cytochrome)